MKTQIKKLYSDKAEFQDKINKIDFVIKAYQSLCDHKNDDSSDAMKYASADSHHQYYKCSICGLEIKK